MNLIEVLRNRRAVREYKDIPISRKEIEELIAEATLAPSAMNLQPWAFAGVSDREQIEIYSKRALEWLCADRAHLPDPEMQFKLAQRLRDDPHFTLFYRAPALVVILAKSCGEQAREDCCLAAENLMLAARDKDFGTCWIGFARPWLNLAEVKAEMGLPQEYEVVAPIVVGYPLAWPESHERNPAEIHWVTSVRASAIPLEV